MNTITITKQKLDDLIWNIREAMRFFEMGSGQNIDVLKTIIEEHLKELISSVEDK